MATIEEKLEIEERLTLNGKEVVVHGDHIEWNDDYYRVKDIKGLCDMVNVESVNFYDEKVSIKDLKQLLTKIEEPLTLNGKEVKYNNVSKRLIFENGESLPIMRIHYLSKDESLKNIIGEDLQQDLKQLLTKIEERENK